jgi:hypothetical protein
MSDDLTAAQFWADLIAVHRVEDTPPPGAKTVREFAEDIHKNISHTRVILSGYVAAGVMECQKFSGPGGHSTNYYWPKEQV